MDYRFLRLKDATHKLPLYGKGLFPADGLIADLDDHLASFWRYCLNDGSLVEDGERTQEIASAIGSAMTHAAAAPALDALRAKWAPKPEAAEALPEAKPVDAHEPPMPVAPVEPHEAGPSVPVENP